MIWVLAAAAAVVALWLATYPSRQAKNEAYGMALHRRNQSLLDASGHADCGGQPTVRYSGSGDLLDVVACTCGRPVKRNPGKVSR